ncbi:hypothetical protein F4808DRAFT_466180 [Astrocystis sublimbata]|nr:hypothetical protein F4808DRAFT_466180 [Astrocystis sublimbata]
MEPILSSVDFTTIKSRIIGSSLFPYQQTITPDKLGIFIPRNKDVFHWFSVIYVSGVLLEITWFEVWYIIQFHKRREDTEFEVYPLLSLRVYELLSSELFGIPDPKCYLSMPGVDEQPQKSTTLLEEGRATQEKINKETELACDAMLAGNRFT